MPRLNALRVQIVLIFWGSKLKKRQCFDVIFGKSLSNIAVVERQAVKCDEKYDECEEENTSWRIDKTVNLCLILHMQGTIRLGLQTLWSVQRKIVTGLYGASKRLQRTLCTLFDL